jgi:hypothetical protein
VPLRVKLVAATEMERMSRKAWRKSMGPLSTSRSVCVCGGGGQSGGVCVCMGEEAMKGGGEQNPPCPCFDCQADKRAQMWGTSIDWCCMHNRPKE